MTGRSRFILGLGLATVGPLVLAPMLAPGRGDQTSQVLGILVVVAYAGHVAVSGWLWTVPDVRQTMSSRPRRSIVLPIALIPAAATVALLLPGRRLGWLLLGFFAWQFNHFQRQNVGLVKKIAKDWHAEPIEAPERRLVAIAGWCGIGALLVRPSLLGLSSLILRSPETGVVVKAAATAYAACAGAALVVVWRRRRPLPVAAAYLTSILFMAPVFLFHSAQGAVTGMVVAHGLQYLWAVRWRTHRARIAEQRSGWPATFAVIAGAVVGGSVLEAMSELHASHDGGLRVLYGAYLGAVMTHFALDGALWGRRIPTRPTSHRKWALLPSPAQGRL